MKTASLATAFLAVCDVAVGASYKVCRRCFYQPNHSDLAHDPVLSFPTTYAHLASFPGPCSCYHQTPLILLCSAKTTQ